MKCEDGPEEIQITGIVSPTGWDESGIVESVCIAADDGKYYFPRLEDKSRVLAGYLRKNVKVTGTISLKRGVRSISISRIEILKRDAD